jgi:hypothetical protein
VEARHEELVKYLVEQSADINKEIKNKYEPKKMIHH